MWRAEHEFLGGADRATYSAEASFSPATASGDTRLILKVNRPQRSFIPTVS